MAAAISAAKENPDLKICVIEKKDGLGKKLLATGNGRCNLTNQACSHVQETLAFFSELGVVTRTEGEGRIYPYCQQSKAVVYGLQRQIKGMKIEVKLKDEIMKTEKEKDYFKITDQFGEVIARKVLIATGGKSAPQYGTTGDGYRFARTLGHHIKKTIPVLAAVETKKPNPELKGIRTSADLRLIKKDIEIARERGELQFTKDGLSGICVFNLSRFIKIDDTTTFGDYSIAIDFLPNMSGEQVGEFLLERTKLDRLTGEDLLLSVLAKPLALELLNKCKVELKSRADQLSLKELAEISELLKGWNVQLSGVKGWKDAQCTAGGVPLEEIDLNTMESRITSGLYFSGEIIDFDGPCGGFNLQNAWETGIKAGRAMAHV